MLSEVGRKSIKYVSKASKVSLVYKQMYHFSSNNKPFKTKKNEQFNELSYVKITRWIKYNWTSTR